MVDCINIDQCENPAVVTLDVVESTTANGTLEYPETRNVAYCADCVGDLTRILVENGTLLSLRVAARLT